MQLQALPAALAAVTAPVGSVCVLAFVIIVHEAGHFLAARSLGMKVKEFSVGIGPKITGFTRKVDSDGDEDEGIEFNLRAIPLGGYVRFPENYNATLGYEFAVEADTKRIEIEKIVKENREKESGGSATGSAGLLSSIGFPFAKDKVTKEERIKALETMQFSSLRKRIAALSGGRAFSEEKSQPRSRRIKNLSQLKWMEQ